MLTLLTCLALQSSPAVISPADVPSSAFFGTAIDIDGDTAIVGAFSDSTAGAQAGSVHFYERSGAGWVRTDVLRGAPFARLGASVTVDGDWAAAAHGSAVKTVEVYERQAGTWARVDVLTYPGDPVGNPQFGSSIDLSGATLAIGSPTASEGGTLGGAVYLYDRTATGWQLTDTLSAMPSGGFPISPDLGRRVTLQGDTLVASAPRASIGGTFSAGALLVFQRLAGAWTYEARLTQPSGVVGTVLGANGLQLDGDRIVASAVGYDQPPLLGVGLVQVFERSGNTWAHAAPIFDPRPSHYGGFGVSMAVQGDRVLVGRSEYHVRELSDFDVTVESFQRTPAGNWAHVDTLPDPNPGPQQGFGHEMALNGSTLMISSSYGYKDGVARGKVYVASYPGTWETVAETVCAGTICACPTSDSWTGCGNSTVREGRLFAAGSASVAADDLELMADQLPSNQTAFFRFGPQLGRPMLLGDGNLCVHTGVVVGVQSTSASGTLTQTSGFLAMAGAAGATVLPGETWYLQLVYDDPKRVFPCRTYPAATGFGIPWNGRPQLAASGFNLTNALAVTWRP